jgi:hypothetical protein
MLANQCNLHGKAAEVEGISNIVEQDNRARIAKLLALEPRRDARCRSLPDRHVE